MDDRFTPTEKYQEQVLTLCKNKDWQRVISLCQGTMRRLAESGDYPEVMKDRLVVERLIDILFYVNKQHLA